MFFNFHDYKHWMITMCWRGNEELLVKRIQFVLIVSKNFKGSSLAQLIAPLRSFSQLCCIYKTKTLHVNLVITTKTTTFLTAIKYLAYTLPTFSKRFSRQTVWGRYIHELIHLRHFTRKITEIDRTSSWFFISWLLFLRAFDPIWHYIVVGQI